MTDLILVRQTLYVEGFECTVTEMIPMYPRLTKCPAPIVKIIALGGTQKKESAAKIMDSAAAQSRTPSGDVSSRGNKSGRR
jgi:hypothetical protein